jgi:hypothetical protein
MRRVTDISHQIIGAPWYVFLIEDVSCWLCDRIPAIPFSRISMIDEDGEQTTCQEYWSDLRQGWHVKVHSPVFEWTHRTIKLTQFEANYIKVIKHTLSKDESSYE